MIDQRPKSAPLSGELIVSSAAAANGDHAGCASHAVFVGRGNFAMLSVSISTHLTIKQDEVQIELKELSVNGPWRTLQ